MTLRAALADGPVALDTAVFIYYIEEHPDYLPLIAPLFAEIDGGGREAVTSALTLLEVLVVPYRAADLALANRYEAVLTRSRGLRVVDVDRAQLRTAAQLRALYRLRTPDALQLAAALSSRCQTFVTNDRELPPIPGLKVVQLKELRPAAHRRRR
jgi:predicted nucleic acid-binding protein